LQPYSHSRSCHSVFRKGRLPPRACTTVAPSKPTAANRTGEAAQAKPALEAQERIKRFEGHEKAPPLAPLRWARRALVFDIALLITAPPIWDVAEARYGFDAFLAESYAAHRAGRPFAEPPYQRRQPSSAAQAGSAPRFDEDGLDADYARDYERRRLLQRTQQAVSFISAPLGITASVLEVSIDGKRLDTMQARQPGGSNINEWLQAFRAGNVGSSRWN
jgi:hypothetical protein